MGDDALSPGSPYDDGIHGTIPVVARTTAAAVCLLRDDSAGCSEQITDYALFPKSSNYQWLYSLVYALVTIAFFQATNVPLQHLAAYHLHPFYVLLSVGLLLTSAVMLGLLALLTLLCRWKISGKVRSLFGTAILDSVPLSMAWLDHLP